GKIRCRQPCRQRISLRVSVVVVGDIADIEPTSDFSMSEIRSAAVTVSPPSTSSTQLLSPRIGWLMRQQPHLRQHVGRVVAGYAHALKQFGMFFRLCGQTVFDPRDAVGQAREVATVIDGVRWSDDIAAHRQRAAAGDAGDWVLSSGSPEPWRRVLAAVRQGLADTGYTEGQNVTIEYRWAEDHYDQLPALAAELVQRRVAAIVAPSVVAAAAAKAATTAVPIVFMVGSDPIEAGLVTSLSHPDRNLTGVAYLNVEVAAKRLDLLHKAVPAATSVALLVNPANTIEADIQTKEFQTAARTLDVR